MTDVANKKLLKSRHKLEQFRKLIEIKLPNADKPLPSTLAELYANRSTYNEISVEIEHDDRVYM